MRWADPRKGLRRMTEETLFAAALEKPDGPERRAFLDAACGLSAALREPVE